ncbi:hypothetical protein [Bradyrhizobium sp. Tv2a-2]|uniref:hypothetical protein n=1 Tax=Bradyrhizobium sp. Tv2a-2 TaxID=113395 RepID=UPI0004637781|nr:hypothetical protein [Bradyrhizobium sp. Tv2a-2]
MMKAHSIKELLAAVRRLPATMPETDRLYKSGYPTHQDHWLGWAGDYNSEDGGYYGRSDTTVTDARTLYQRLNCGPMILWLVEALGVSPVQIRMAINDMNKKGNGRAQTEAKIAREHFPWERVSLLLFK